ncbi:hypothetical protein EUCA11A_39990 [Eubacterium callanderi]|uniref:hypothetical protein n=1 Tax=Eubacterium callanderi TaxID=53442 RepID=UPI0029FF0990|nr:hypothetical protein [Eubacterium callanderi]WPK69809.1 hypothetical protein EUCA2A_39990 [Eubacterium callanderi]WPK74107.1 hypothetical protein EUCA11A_39990 [Eubacterium callanderi]
MDKKRKILLVAVMAIGLVTLVRTSAFFTRGTITDNVLTFGNARVTLLETTLDASGNEVELSGEESFDITQASDMSRIVRLKNTGHRPVFARISLKLESEKNDGTTAVIKNRASYQTNETDWVYEDGWYYYKKVLEPDITTEELMTKVIFDIDKITQEYPGEKLKLKIEAQAVQSEYNHPEVLKAAGWPEEGEATK